MLAYIFIGHVELLMVVTFCLATRVKPYGMTQVSGLDPKGRSTTPPVALNLSLYV